MKKKIKKIFSTLLLLVPFPVYAQEQAAEAQQQITASGLSNVLVPFLYLAVVLALIYIILLLIERHAKKHNQSSEQEQDLMREQEKIQKETDTAGQAPEQSIENAGSDNSKDKENNE